MPWTPHAIAIGSAAVWLPTHVAGMILKHEIVDGKKREVSCKTLQNCIEKGVSSPGILMHKAWAVELEDAMLVRSRRVEGLNQTAVLARQRQVRSVLRRRLLQASLASQDVPPARLVRRFTDEDRGVDVTLLLFEVWPGHPIPAAIFEPHGARSSRVRLPAVLHLPGHLASGLRHPEEQAMSLSLAQRGYVVLSFDPISQGERLQYQFGSGLECNIQRPAESDDGDCSASGPPCSRAHDHYGQQLWLMGKSLAELVVRDAQRALDLLSSLPWVDPRRVGAVGCSGGGMLTAYLAAVDARVTAACVACYFSTLQEELEVGNCNYDAEQILWKQAKYGIDKPDLLSARAPNASMILLTSHDCFPLSGGRQGFDEVTRTFAAHPFGATNLYCSEAPGHHEVTEIGVRALQDFFQQQLKETALETAQVPDPKAPKSTKPLSCNQLWFGEDKISRGVTDSPRFRILDHLRSVARPLLRRLRARRRVAFAAFRDSGAGGRWLKLLRNVSARMAGLDEDAIHEVARALRGDELPLPSLLWMQYGSGHTEEWFLLQTYATCAVTIRLFRPLRPHVNQTLGETPPVALLIGGGALLNRGLSTREDMLIAELLHRGFTVAVAGLCGLGDSLWKGGLKQYAPLLVGRTHVGLHAGEVLRLAAWAIAILGARRIVIVASGAITSAALHAALHMPSIADSAAALQVSGPGVKEHLASKPDVAPMGIPAMASALVGLVLVRGMCCYGDIAVAPRHRMPWPMQMHGVLEQYDLPDLLAAAARNQVGATGFRALVIEPRGADGRLMPSRRAHSSFSLSKKRLGSGAPVLNRGSRGKNLKLLPGRRSDQAEARAIALFAKAVAGAPR